MVWSVRLCWLCVLDEKRLVKPGRAPADEHRSCFPQRQEALGGRCQGSFSLARLEMIEETREGSSSVLRKGKEGQEGGQREVDMKSRKSTRRKAGGGPRTVLNVERARYSMTCVMPLGFVDNWTKDYYPFAGFPSIYNTWSTRVVSRLVSIRLLGLHIDRLINRCPTLSSNSSIHFLAVWLMLELSCQV